MFNIINHKGIIKQINHSDLSCCFSLCCIHDVKSQTFFSLVILNVLYKIQTQLFYSTLPPIYQQKKLLRHNFFLVSHAINMRSNICFCGHRKEKHNLDNSTSNDRFGNQLRNDSSVFEFFGGNFQFKFQRFFFLALGHGKLNKVIPERRQMFINQ